MGLKKEFKLTQDKIDDLVDILERENFQKPDIKNFINLAAFICDTYWCRFDEVPSSTLIKSITTMQKNIDKLSKLLERAINGKEPVVHFNVIDIKLSQTCAQFQSDGFGDLRGNILLVAQHAKFSLKKLDSLLRDYSELAAPNRINGRPRADSDNFIFNILRIYESCFPVTVVGDDDAFHNLSSILLEAVNLGGDATSRIQHALEKTSSKK